MVKYNRINGNAMYNCAICNKLTRDTGNGEAELGYCKKCLFECYMENAANDYGTDSQQFKDAEKAYNECK